MKVLLISVCLLLVTLVASAKNATENSLYVFDTFQKGIVYMNDGDSTVKRMNYNAGTEEIIFEQQGKLMALDNLNLVQRIKIGESIFEPIDGKFYQKIGSCSNSLFVSYKFKVIPPSAPSAYGSESSTSASTSWSSLAGKNNLYELTIPSEYKIIRSKDFYLIMDNKLCPVNKFSQVIKLYPEKEDLLKKYIKANKLGWNEIEDVQKIIEFCCKSVTVLL